ncbi:MAG: hypothetical protein MJZ81_11905 [Bacteroidales bacterium]|nr:hypothetical protein [Bacteroidales bacterium]
MAKQYTAYQMRVAAKACEETGQSMVAGMLRQAAEDIGHNEKIRKEVNLYKKTFRKICGCLNKDIKVGVSFHTIDGNTTSVISDCGALSVISEMAEILKDTVEGGEETNIVESPRMYEYSLKEPDGNISFRHFEDIESIGCDYQGDGYKIVRRSVGEWEEVANG